MGEFEDFEAEGFTQFTEAEGALDVEIMDMQKKIRYKARCFINRAGTIGYADVNLEGANEKAFFSKTKLGAILTLTGEQTGRIPMEVEGLHTIMSVHQGMAIEAICAEHRKAFDGEPAIRDEAWLRAEMPKVPIKAINIGVAFVKKSMEAIKGAGETTITIGNGPGETVGQEDETSTAPKGPATRPKGRTPPRSKGKPKPVKKKGK